MTQLNIYTLENLKRGALNIFNSDPILNFRCSGWNIDYPDEDYSRGDFFAELLGENGAYLDTEGTVRICDANFNTDDASLLLFPPVGGQPPQKEKIERFMYLYYERYVTLMKPPIIPKNWKVNPYPVSSFEKYQNGELIPTIIFKNPFRNKMVVTDQDHINQLKRDISNASTYADRLTKFDNESDDVYTYIKKHMITRDKMMKTLTMRCFFENVEEKNIDFILSRMVHSASCMCERCEKLNFD
jgi:hypothetical protein